MRNINLKIYKKIIFGILVLLLVVVSWVAFITEENKDVTRTSVFLTFAIDNHSWIMFSLVIVSVAVGFFWSRVLYSEIQKKKKDSQEIFDVVLLFLSREEKHIVNFLVEKKGETTQAEIARLPTMTRLKAFRALQKMRDKNLLEVLPHGKVRRVRLKENIFSILRER